MRVLLSPVTKRASTLALLLLSMLALLAPSTARADADEQKLRAIVDASIRPLMAQHDVPGMAVALAVGGRTWVFNYGVVSKIDPAPVGDSTIFEIGSISKMFTTTLAALGQATGRLSLQDHPGRHLPQLKGRPIDRATLLHLGTYTAGGLPLQFPDAVGDDAAALAYLRDWQPGDAPGTVRRYSNPSIGLLGAATAAAMKGSFADLVEAQLLRPLGMSHTFVKLPPQAMADYAWGHREGRTVRLNPGPMGEPAYGIRTTASDLLRFLSANIDPAGLDAPLREAIRLTQIGRFSVAGMVQGFGWEQFPYPVSRERLLGGNAAEIIFEPNRALPVGAREAAGPRLFDKTGSTGGFGAYVAFVPARRIGLVMLANRSFPIPARIEAAHAILEQMDPGGR